MLVRLYNLMVEDTVNVLLSHLFYKFCQIYYFRLLIGRLTRQYNHFLIKLEDILINMIY